MLLKIAKDWGTGFEGGIPYAYLALAVEGAGVKRMHVKVSMLIAQTLASDAKALDGNLAQLTTPVMLLILNRCRQLGRDGLEPLLGEVGGKPMYIFQISEDDAMVARRLAAEKRCKYRDDDNGDVSCRVGLDPSSLNPATFAVTYRKCADCTMPDELLVCSNLCHPRVFVPNGQTALTVWRADCHCDREEVRQDATGCRPGRHHCWQRNVDVEEVDEPWQALGLHELFELVDARWKGAFQQHLVGGHRSTALGKLAMPCQTAADLEAKLSALAQLMKACEVSEALLKDEHSGKDDYKQGKTFARIESALERVLVNDPEAISRVKKSVRVLRDANSLRNGVQHGGGVVVQAYARFGLPYPPPAARETWGRIQSRVGHALREISDAMADL